MKQRGHLIRMQDTSQIDAETWAFIRKTAECYPDDGAALPVQAQRQAYDAMCAVFRAPRPASVIVQDQHCAGVPSRLYSTGPSDVTAMYFHGGGFVVGGLDSHDDVCAEICARTGYRVISVDYRLAPEHKHPAAYDDCLAVTLWAAKTFGGTLLLAGDSAGACLAAAVSSTMKAEISGQVLIYGSLGGDRSRGSYVSQSRAPMLTTEDLTLYEALRYDGPPPTGDATAMPLAASDFTGLPPTILITASCDPVRDDSRDYRDRIVAAGGRAQWIDEPGLVHSYLRARHSVARAAESFDRITGAVRALGAGNWPY